MTINEFYEKYCCIENEQHFIGLIEKENKKIILFPMYREIRPCLPLANGEVKYLKVRQKDSYFLCNLEGEKITPTYEYITGFTDGIAAFKKAGLWGFFNSDAQEFVPSKYTSIKRIEVGLFKIKIGNKWGLVSRNGIEAKPVYSDVIVRRDLMDKDKENVYVEFIP